MASKLFVDELEPTETAACPDWAWSNVMTTWLLLGNEIPSVIIIS